MNGNDHQGIFDSFLNSLTQDIDPISQGDMANLGINDLSNLTNVPEVEGLGSLLAAVSAELTLKDQEYVDKLNHLLTILGETYRLNVENSCYNRGIYHYQQRKYQLAIEDLSQAITLNPNLIDAYIHWGKAYDELGQHAEASSKFRLALKLQGQTFEN